MWRPWSFTTAGASAKYVQVASATSGWHTAVTPRKGESREVSGGNFFWMHSISFFHIPASPNEQPRRPPIPAVAPRASPDAVNECSMKAASAPAPELH